MPRLKYLGSAKRDLVHILRFVTERSGSLDVGRGFVGALREKCRHLASLPGLVGRPRPELGAEIRSFPVGGYVIFFRYADEAFEIIDVLEGHRDVEQHLGPGNE